MCNRNFGVGADGILGRPLLSGEGISMTVWNPDGSRTERSGNGVRIFAKYLKDAGYVQKRRSPGKRWEARRQSFISTRMRPV